MRDDTDDKNDELEPELGKRAASILDIIQDSILRRNGETPTHEQLQWQMPGNYGPIPVASSDFRGPTPTLGVTTDGEAIAVWLADCADRSVNTAQSYRSAVERLVFWASEVKGLSISQLTRINYIEFHRFMRSVPDDWIMDKRYRRTDHRWRPFLGQPSEQTIAHTMVIIGRMLTYFVNTGWLLANPMPKPRSLVQKEWRPAERAIPDKIVRLFLEATVVTRTDDMTMKDVIFKARDRWIVICLLYLGPRVSETRTFSGSFRQANIQGELMWVWDVFGKGRQMDTIPVPDYVLDELRCFRKILNLPELPSKGEKFPLIPSLEGMSRDGMVSKMPSRMTRSAIYRRLKEVVIPLVNNLASERGINADILEHVSPHWFRHTTVTAIVSKDGDLKAAQTIARHKNINTTAKYVQTDFLRAKEALGKIR